MCADQHLSQFDKVAVLFVVDLNDAPRIAATSNFAAFWVGDLVVGTNNGERDLGHDLIILGNRLLVVELVAGSFEDVDRVVLDIAQDL